MERREDMGGEEDGPRTRRRVGWRRRRRNTAPPSHPLLKCQLPGLGPAQCYNTRQRRRKARSSHAPLPASRRVVRSSVLRCRIRTSSGGVGPWLVETNRVCSSVAPRSSRYGTVLIDRSRQPLKQHSNVRPRVLSSPPFQLTSSRWEAGSSSLCSRS